MPRRAGPPRDLSLSKGLARLVAVLLLGLAVTAGVSRTAAADPFDMCLSPPRASLPDKGSAGWLTGEPDWATVPAVAPDPFAKDSPVAVADVYGYNFDWTVYDLGCGNDLLRDPQAVAQTTTANMLMQHPSLWVALQAQVQDLVTASPMGWVQDMIARINTDVATKLWNTWFPVTLVAAGGWVILRSRKSQYAETAAALGGVMIVVTVSVFLLNYPAKASTAIDNLADQAVQLASAPFPGTGSSDAIVRNVLYPQWLQGEFGSASSPTALRYGPDLFWATHYTWSEYKQIREDPKNLEIIDERKGDRFKQIAGEIEQSDPMAYAHLTGKDSAPRVGAAIMAYPFAGAAVIFMLVNLFMLAIAKVMLQAFIVAAPIAGLVGAHPRGHRVLMSMWDIFTAAILATAKFALFAGLFGLFLSSILTADINPVQQLFWLLVITVIAFALARPFHTLKTLTPGMNPNRSYLRDMLSLVSSRLGSQPAPAASVAAVTATSAVTPADSPRRAEDESLPALPARTAISASSPPLDQTRTAIGTGVAADAGATPVDPEQAAGAPRYQVRQVFIDDDDPTGTGPRLAQAPVEMGALPAGPVVGRPRGLEPAQVPVDPAMARPSRLRSRSAVTASAVVSGAVVGGAVGGSARPVPEAQDPTGATLVEFPHTVARTDLSGAVQARPLVVEPSPATHAPADALSGLARPTVPAAVSGRVMEPDGGAPLYRSWQEGWERAEMRPAEVQLDADGNESYVIYRSLADSRV